VSLVWRSILFRERRCVGRPLRSGSLRRRFLLFWRCIFFVAAHPAHLVGFGAAASRVASLLHLLRFGGGCGRRRIQVQTVRPLVAAARALSTLKSGLLLHEHLVPLVVVHASDYRRGGAASAFAVHY